MNNNLRRILPPHLFGIAFLLSLFTVGCTESKSDKIENAIQKGRSFLESIQRGDGAIADTSNPLFDTWETILATQALVDSPSDQPSEPAKAALSYLKNNENRHGLMCHNQKCRREICLETSAEYVRLLNMIRPEADYFGRVVPVLQAQKANGSWDIGNPDVRVAIDFPSVTGFVLGMLNVCDLGANDHNKAIEWLVAQQHPEGHWGKSWEYYGCTSYALWPIIGALSAYDDEASTTAIEKAQKYILNSQKVDGSWYEKGNELRKVPSSELQTALMINALQNCNPTKTQGAIDKGIDFLLTQQSPNGSWEGGYFPIESQRYVKREYVVATALSILALKASRDAI